MNGKSNMATNTRLDMSKKNGDGDLPAKATKVIDAHRCKVPCRAEVAGILNKTIGREESCR